MTLTLKDLIAKAFEREGFMFISLEYSEADLGNPYWVLTVEKDSKIWKGDLASINWLELGPGSEVQVHLSGEWEEEIEVGITLGAWEVEEEHEARVRRSVDTLTTRHSQLLEWAPSFFIEEDLRKLETADHLLCLVLERLASY